MKLTEEEFDELASSESIDLACQQKVSYDSPIGKEYDLTETEDDVERGNKPNDQLLDEEEFSLEFDAPSLDEEESSLEFDAPSLDGSSLSEEENTQELSEGSSIKEKRKAYKKNILTSFKIFKWLNGNFLLPLLKKENMLLAVEIAVLFFIYISMGLLRIDKVNKIDKLEERMRQLEYRQLFIMSELGKLNREESVLNKLQEMGSTLVPDNDPPFVIYYDGKAFEKEQKEKYSTKK